MLNRKINYLAFDFILCCPDEGFNMHFRVIDGNDQIVGVRPFCFLDYHLSNALITLFLPVKNPQKMIDRRQFKGTSIFIVFQDLIETELKEVEEYISETSTNLNSMQVNLEKDYQEANKEIEYDPDYDTYSYFEDDIHKYFKVFPFYTYNPLLLTLYGQFESWLKKLCDLDSRKGFSKVTVKDLAGNNYIEKSRRYLEIVSEINLDDTKSVWQKIMQIQRLRNCIAHNDANIVKDKSSPIEKNDLYKLLLNDTRFQFDRTKGDFYIKDPSFLIETIALIKEYLFSVIGKIKAKKVVARNMAMPYDNTTWGQEKTETLLKQIISALDQLDGNETRTDEHKDSDLKYNLRGTLASMTGDLTKLYSFFSNGKWNVIDATYIVEERQKGLDKIKLLYEIK